MLPIFCLCSFVWSGFFIQTQSASWNEKIVLDDQSGTDGGSCESSNPCESLKYAISYINNNQSIDSNNVSVIMNVDDDAVGSFNITNSTYQQWNLSLIVSDSDANYTSSYIISGESPDISLVEVYASTFTDDSAVYIDSQYGVNIELSDFTLANGDTTYDRHFLYSRNNLADGSYLFRNINFDGLTWHDDFVYNYNSDGSYGHSQVVFEDCIISGHLQAGYLVDAYRSGGVSMENVILQDNSFLTFVLYIRQRYSSNSTNEDVSYSTSDIYFRNIEISNSTHSDTFFRDYSSYVDDGSFEFSNIVIDNLMQFDYLFYLRSFIPSYKTSFSAINITIRNSEIENNPFYLRNHGSNGFTVSNIVIQDCTWVDTLLYVFYLSYDGSILIGDITYNNLSSINIWRFGFFGANDISIYNINVTDTAFNSIVMEFYWANGDYEFKNLYFNNVETDSSFLSFIGEAACNVSYETYEKTCNYTVGEMIVENYEAVDSRGAFSIVMTRAHYFEATNVSFSSTHGLDFEGSYTSGIWSMDFLHIGTTQVENLTMTDTVVYDSVYSQFGWKEAYVDGITCDNVHTDNFWVYFQIYNTGKWKNYIENIYFNGHYEDNNMSSIKTFWNCTGYNCKYWAQGIFYLYYDGDASTPIEGGRRRRMMDRLPIEMEDFEMAQHEDYTGADETDFGIGNSAASETRRKLLDFYDVYYNPYDKNYTMTNCSENMDVYRNVTLIDNAINGPLVMMDIDTNDCDMIFDNWYVEKTVNLLNRSWNSENANSVGSDRSDGSYSFPDYSYGNAGGEYNYVLAPYEWYYQYRENYPDIEAGYIPPPLFFVYQYHDKNLGVVRIENSRFENNDGFPIVSCGAYSYCNIVIKNCFFKNNVFEYEGTTYYNAIWMDDNSFGTVKISNSRFIGGYDEQGGDYSINWLYNPNTNSTFECNNCTISPPTSAPTSIPSDMPTGSPTTAKPSVQPTEIPTPILIDVAISVSIDGEISSDLDQETAEDIIETATRTILDEAEDGPYVYDDVTVEVTLLTTEQVDANIYVSETDITQEEFIDLVESDLAAAIEQADINGYFSSVDRIEGSSELTTSDDEDNSNDFPWEWVVIVCAGLLLLIIAGGIYDYFCIHKPDKENATTQAAIGATLEPGATPGGTQIQASNTSASNANAMEDEPALPTEAELVVMKQNGNGTGTQIDLPARPGTVAGGGGLAMGATNAGFVNAEIGDNGNDLVDGNSDDDVLVEGQGNTVTGDAPRDGPGEQFTPGTSGGGEGA